MACVHVWPDSLLDQSTGANGNFVEFMYPTSIQRPQANQQPSESRHLNLMQTAAKRGQLEPSWTHILNTGWYGINMGWVRVRYGFRKPGVSETNPGFTNENTGWYGINMGLVRVQYGFKLPQNANPNFFFQIMCFYEEKCLKPVVSPIFLGSNPVGMLGSCSNNPPKKLVSKLFGKVPLQVLRYFQGWSSPQIFVQII